MRVLPIATVATPTALAPDIRFHENATDPTAEEIAQGK